MAALPDGVLAWGCGLVGLAFLLPRVRAGARRSIVDSSRRSYLVCLATATLLLNVAYVHVYLRGGPRIIDATSYWLQARVFAAGQFTFAAPGPVHSFVGRFLVVTPSGELAVLFPPGFAALLAIGVRLGLPLLINPLLGAACAVLTYALGRAWWDETVGRVAGVLSGLCAALRYHSADTMSHIWCACLILGLLLAMTARPPQPTASWGWPLLGGACAGWLFATRPVTGVVFGMAGLWAALWPGVGQPRPLAEAARSGLAYVSGCAPGLCLWFTYQWVTTGSVFGSTQAVYYARGDWPSDCFTLGFGAHIGCQFEHGDFLADYQPNGYGPREALAVCGRRLWAHVNDVANLPWLPLVSLLTLRRSTRSRAVVVSWTLIVAHIAAYALFYYDGNYPGGGARLYAELLPLQHLLLVVALSSLTLEWAAVPLAALGFALWSSKQHAHLAEREGGRPMFEAAIVASAGVKQGLVFVSTDHGFNLGFDPASTAADSPRVARARGAALDYATWMNAGAPAAYRYVYDPYRADSTATLAPYTPEPDSTFFGVHLWPPLHTDLGSATPNYGACGGLGLSLHPVDDRPQRTRVQLWVNTPGDYQLEAHADPNVELEGWPMAAPDASLVANGCVSRVSAPRRLGPGPLVLTLKNVGPGTVGWLRLRAPSDQ